MNEVLKYEKTLYFRDTKHYIQSWITRDHNYLIWKYICCLRKEEDTNNKILKYWHRRRKNILGARLGFLIYEGSCGKGLKIWHYGNIIINGYSKIGENCVLHGQNCIGNKGDSSPLDAPTIGNNVDIGVGASIIGGVFIADGVKIGAGAVVTKSCYEKGATLVGIPAYIKNNMDK